MADINSTLPVTDTADGTDGAVAPVVATEIGGVDGSGNLQSLLVDTAGKLQISIVKAALAPASPVTFSVGVASSTAVAFNANRKGLTLINLSSGRMSFGLGVAAVAASGITLLPGGVWVMDEYTFTTASINAISTVASSVLSIQEFN